MQDVLAVVSDLMFTVKIGDAAKRAGLTALFVGDFDRALAKAAEQPKRIILDLNLSSARPIELIRALKATEAAATIPLLGFVSHVQADLIRAAQEAGCDRVVPRSVLSSRIDQLIAGAA